jgi:hypothetical protein
MIILATYIIGGLIALAVVLVIVKLIRDKMNGKACNCGCSECPQSCKEKK